MKYKVDKCIMFSQVYNNKLYRLLKKKLLKYY